MAANKKKTEGKTEELDQSEETGLAAPETTSISNQMSIEDMFAVDNTADHSADAGAGSENIDAKFVSIPRISILQGLSPIVVEETFPGIGVAGVLWLSPFNRPMTSKVGSGKDAGFTPMRFVVVKLQPAWRRWTPKNEGGGIECEAPDGDFKAREPSGLAGARFVPEFDGDRVKSFKWEGGHPTDSCSKCVFGPGAGPALSGDGKGNHWLPKVAAIDGRSVKIPDELRAPRCTQSLDYLVLAMAQRVGDFKAELVPAFLSFSRTGYTAGSTLAGMLKMASAREPVWGRVYELGVKKVTNDKGTFYVPTVNVLGGTSEPLAAMARELHLRTTTENIRMDISGEEPAGAQDAGGGHVPAPSAPGPTDQF